MAGEILCGHGLMEVYLPCAVTSPDGLAVWRGTEREEKGTVIKGHRALGIDLLVQEDAGLTQDDGRVRSGEKSEVWPADWGRWTGLSFRRGKTSPGGSVFFGKGHL